MIESMIELRVEPLERKGFVAAPDSTKILLASGSMDARHLPCR